MIKETKFPIIKEVSMKLKNPAFTGEIKEVDFTLKNAKYPGKIKIVDMSLNIF